MIQFFHVTAPDDPHPAQRPLTTRRKILFTGSMVIIVLVTIELGLRLFYQPIKPEPIDQKLARIPEYARFDWPKELFTEERQTKTKFLPWIMWRKKEFHGKYITVTPEGLRKTWNPLGTQDQKVKKVFCFGGSATWGIGARDDFTIPSLLSKKLNQGLDRFVVVNYGEQGFTFRQEVINLVLLLIQGNIPDYVIFYDGINETMVGFANRKAGSFYNAKTVEFQLIKKDNFWFKLRQTLQESSIYTAGKELRAWVRRLFEKDQGFSPEDLEEMNRLTDDIVEDYLRNVKFVKKLSEAFGFKCLFIWQPALFTNKALTSDEKKEPTLSYKGWVKTTELVYEQMAKVKMDHFYNISDMFDHKNKTLFFSWAHITEEGNELVADRIYHIFQKEFAPNLSAGPVAHQ